MICVHAESLRRDRAPQAWIAEMVAVAEQQLVERHVVGGAERDPEIDESPVGD